MGEMIGRVQDGLQRSSGDLALFVLRLVSGLILGLTFALIMQEVLGRAETENLISFLLVIITTSALFLRISKSWGLTGVLVFDLVAVLIGMILRLYIMVAPGT